MYAYAAEAQPAISTHGGTAHIQTFDVMKKNKEYKKEEARR
jgi:hypothetical protein